MDGCYVSLTTFTVRRDVAVLFEAFVPTSVSNGVTVSTGVTAASLHAGLTKVVNEDGRYSNISVASLDSITVFPATFTTVNSEDNSGSNFGN